MRHCSKCDLTLADTAGFCKKCGGALSDDEIAITERTANSLDLNCPNCGKLTRLGASFCKACGKPIRPKSADHAVKVVGENGNRQLAHSATVGAAPHLRAPNSTAYEGNHTNRTSQSSAMPSSDRPVVAFGTRTEQIIPCSKCGAVNKSGMRFCKSCRAPIGDYAKNLKTRKIVAIAAAASAGAVVIVAFAAWYLWGVKVAIESEPPDSRVAIDGKEVGVTNSFGALAVSHIRAGEHTYVIKHNGYDDLKGTFRVALSDWSKELKLKLNLTKYRFTIVSSPGGSDVVVDNSSVGTTGESDGVLETPPFTPGDHVVTVRKEGYRDWKQTVNLKQDTKLDVVLTSAPVYDPDSSYADSEIRSTLEGWAQSTRNRDVDSHLRYYADTLDYYYSRTLVPSSKVREDRERAFAKFNYLSVQLSNMNVQLDSTGQRATVVFDKTFDFRGDFNAFYNGSVQDQLTLTKLGGSWLITGEKELRVYYVNK